MFSFMLKIFENTRLSCGFGRGWPCGVSSLEQAAARPAYGSYFCAYDDITMGTFGLPRCSVFLAAVGIRDLG
jgi:hypothetical protein